MAHPISILINASTCTIGGGVQVSVGFIHYLHEQCETLGWEVTVVASEKVYHQCKNLTAKTGWNLVLIAQSPAKLIRGRSARKSIYEIIKNKKCKICFTVFGPSYLSLDIPEFTGFANPYVTNPGPFAFKNYTFFEKLFFGVIHKIKKYYLSRAKEFWVETATAQKGLAKALAIDVARIHVVPNTINPLFVPSPALPAESPLRFLYLSAYYKHKNHFFLIDVAQALKNKYPSLKFKFVVSLPQHEFPFIELMRRAKYSALAEHFETLGYLNVQECAQAYAESHVVFHPSLLEVFSATYLEAFAAQRPLVVSDLDFAHEICGPGAIYFNPASAEDAAQALYGAATDKELREKMIMLGSAQLSLYPKTNEKCYQLVSLIKSFMARYV
jgi:glycosyltransferase involved in cell wall biosynthesis